MTTRPHRRAVLVLTLLAGLAGYAAPAVGAGARRARGPQPLRFVARLHRYAEAEPVLRLPRAAANPVTSAPVTYYVDASAGDDANTGASPDKPWRTLARAERVAYRGGDTILLHGGERFRGTLMLGTANVRATSRRRPLTIGSYGRGRAVIAPGPQSGIVAIDVSGIRITRLDLAGHDAGCNRGSSGIAFDARAVNGVLSRGIAIDHVDVHGFCDGIAIGSEDDKSKIAHVRISRVSAHDNGDAGVVTDDPAFKQHDVRDVVISYTRAFRNRDQGGIVLFGVERAVVEHSVAFGNGRGRSGAVGIWAFDADRVVIRDNESYGNMTAGDDGDGFDLDGGVTNSVLEHNYSHDNAGVGFLVCACVGWYQPRHDTIAYNTSSNDGSSGQTSAVYVGGGTPFQSVRVVANRAYSTRGAGPLVSIAGDDSPYRDVQVRDNRFAAGRGKTLLVADPAHGTRVTFEGDRWYACAGSFRVTWGTRQYRSFGAWRRATGVERRGRGGVRNCRARRSIGHLRP